MADIEKIKSRIQALLTLGDKSRNASIEEAAVAFAQAQKIASKYGLDLDEISAEKAQEWEPPTLEDIKERLLYKGGRVTQWRISIAQAVAKANMCKIFSRPRTGLFVCGQPRDMDTVAYMFNLICREVDRLAQGVKGMGKSYINGFRVGAAIEIGKKVQDSAREALAPASAPSATCNENALVVQNKLAEYSKGVQGAIDIYMKKNLDLKTAPRNRCSANGYRDGRIAGQSVKVGGGRALKG